MVSAAFLLLTVSTLAIHGKYVSNTDSTIQRGEEMTFSDQKPANYPQGAIDWLLTQNLTLHHRMRRDAAKNMPTVAAGSADGNCEVHTKMVTPYELKAEGLVPQILVQSQFFNQQIPEVTCKSPDKPCFNAFIRDGSGITAQCKPKYVSTKLYVYDAKDNEIKLVDGQVPIDCVCVVA